MRGDFATYCTNSIWGGIMAVLISPSLQFIWLYRLAHFLTASRLSFLAGLLHYLQQIIFSSSIAPRAKLGDRVLFPHPFCVVIGEAVVIGDRVKIFQQVTIGSHGRIGEGAKYPQVMDHAILFAGAKIIGDVTVGKHAVVGANAVVISDVPDYAVAVGVPARIAKIMSEADLADSNSDIDSSAKVIDNHE
jgi:serine O-acetyltransferase